MESKIANPQSVKIAQRLRTLRESVGLNPEQLSRAIYEKSGVEIGRNSIINYEVGESYNTKTNKNLGMRSEYVIAFADFYGVSTDYILCLTDIPNIDTNMQAVHKFIGLSEQAIDFLRRSYKNNPMYMRSDVISFLLENERFQLLLDMIIGFGTSNGKKIPYDVVSNGVSPIVTDTDVFRAKAIDLFSSILLDSKGAFPKNEVEREFYKLCRYQYANGASLEQIKDFFEQNGLTFDSKLIGIGEEE